jgi:hypothetical protein
MLYRHPPLRNSAAPTLDFSSLRAEARLRPLFEDGPLLPALRLMRPCLRGSGRNRGASPATAARLPAPTAPSSSRRPSSYNSTRPRSPSPSPRLIESKQPRLNVVSKSTRSATSLDSTSCRPMSLLPRRCPGKGDRASKSRTRSSRAASTVERCWSLSLATRRNSRHPGRANIEEGVV